VSSHTLASARPSYLALASCLTDAPRTTLLLQHCPVYSFYYIILYVQTVTTQHCRLGDLALTECDLPLVEKCATNSSDLGGLLLLHSAMGNSDGMAALAATAAAAGKTNVAFLALLLCGRVEECLELLVSAGRLPEAAFMARTYLPSEVPRLVAMWKDDLKTVSVKAAEALADPEKYPNMFEVHTLRLLTVV
jgi:Coatomer WD associated region